MGWQEENLGSCTESLEAMMIKYFQSRILLEKLLQVFFVHRLLDIFFKNNVNFIFKRCQKQFHSNNYFFLSSYGLLKFVIAVLGYCAVYREVKPKKDKVEALEKEYSEAVNYLDSLNREINRLQKTLDGLNARYDTAIMRKQELQEETDLMMRRLVAADKLMSGEYS